MSPDGFARYSALLDELTVDLVRDVPDDNWDVRPTHAVGSRGSRYRIISAIGSQARPSS